MSTHRSQLEYLGSACCITKEAGRAGAAYNAIRGLISGGRQAVGRAVNPTLNAMTKTRGTAALAGAGVGGAIGGVGSGIGSYRRGEGFGTAAKKTLAGTIGGASAGAIAGAVAGPKMIGNLTKQLA